MPRGRFITLEGGEGTGKSTQAKALAAKLEAAGHVVVMTREPGGSRAAERVREALLGLTPEEGAWTADTECLLHYAARAQHAADVIRPALDAGCWVVSDRFADSTRAYQGYAGGLPLPRIEELHRWTLGAFEPDLTLILDLPVAAGLARAAKRGAAPDVYERRPKTFHEAVRAGFLAIAEAAPERCAVIDADGELMAVADAIWAAVTARLGAA